jgi:hypothetical protein
MKAKIALLGGGLLLAGANAMACYTVYDGGSRIVYQGVEAPVDMSLPLHTALAQRFPRGAQMVFDQTAICTPVGLGQLPRPAGADAPPNTIRLERNGAAGASSSAPAPLLTDKTTAERANLPHTDVASNVVVVPPAVAERAMHASVTVLPATTFAGNTANTGVPDTTALGAGPARLAAPTASPRPPGSKPNVVITEMRDPPVTIIETNGTRIVTPQY